MTQQNKVSGIKEIVMKKRAYFVAILFVMGLVCTAAYADLADGLVGYWSFDDGTAKDNSGTGNHGDILGDPGSVNGRVGKGMDFDGDGDGIDVPDNATVQLPDALTVGAWVYVRSMIDHAGIVWKGEMIGWGMNFNYRIATTTAGLTWGTTNGEAENYFATDGAINLEEWTFVVMTADGTEATGRVSKDGAPFEIPASGQGNPQVSSSAPYNVWEGQPLRIGYSQGRDGDLAVVDYFDGIIDEVVLYNRALNEDEIVELMTQGLPTTAVAPAGKLATTWSDVKTR